MCQTTFNTSIRLPYGTANEWEMLGPFAVTLCKVNFILERSVSLERTAHTETVTLALPSKFHLLVLLEFAYGPPNACARNLTSSATKWELQLNNRGLV